VAYDPGWHAWANGKPVPVQMLAPAVMGVALKPGHYLVTLRYEGFGGYPELWGAGLLALVLVALVDRRLASWWAVPPAGTAAAADDVPPVTEPSGPGLSPGLDGPAADLDGPGADVGGRAAELDGELGQEATRDGEGAGPWPEGVSRLDP